MEWTQFALLFLSLGGMWLTSRSDWKRTDTKIEEHRKETNEILRAIQIEMKDFHGRLCALEEKYREIKK